MPAPTFVALIFAVIAAAGATIGLLHLTGLSPLWAGLGGLVLAAAVRGLAWR